MPTIPPMSWLRLLAANPFPSNPPKANGFLFQPEFIQDIQNILFSLVGTDDNLTIIDLFHPRHCCFKLHDITYMGILVQSDQFLLCPGLHFKVQGIFQISLHTVILVSSKNTVHKDGKWISSFHGCRCSRHAGPSGIDLNNKPLSVPVNQIYLHRSFKFQGLRHIEQLFLHLFKMIIRIGYRSELHRV